MEEPYLVPDYYPAFSCKMGACRSACCVGWPITFSLEDYFRLTGSECSPELRQRSDDRAGRQSSGSKWQEWVPKLAFSFKDAGTRVWRREGRRSRLPIPHPLWLG